MSEPILIALVAAVASMLGALVTAFMAWRKWATGRVVTQSDAAARLTGAASDFIEDLRQQLHDQLERIISPKEEPPHCACGCGGKVRWDIDLQRWNTYLDHHWPKTRAIPTPPPEDAPLCHCGCGNQVTWDPYRNRWNTWYPHHHRRKAKQPEPEAPLCSCGCGQPVKWSGQYKRWREFIHGHNARTESHRQLSSQIRKNSRNPSKYTYVRCDYCGKEKRITPCLLKQQGKFFCGFECKARYYSGERNPLYRHGKTPLSYIGNWHVQRKRALKRDSYACRHCGKKPHRKRSLHVHHIIPLETFDDNYEEAHRLTNLITLCFKCHKKAERGKIAIQPVLM